MVITEKFFEKITNFHRNEGIIILKVMNGLIKLENIFNKFEWDAMI